MIILTNTLVFIISFSVMEFVAWWTHKYIMHGMLWALHQDHHNKNSHHFFEKNDLFALMFAVPSIIFIITGTQTGLDKVYFWIGSGITLYGAAYFFAHDVFIHQRIRLLRNVNIRYFKALRRAHKIHHKHLNKDDGESFGFLWVPKKYREDLNI